MAILNILLVQWIFRIWWIGIQTEKSGGGGACSFFFLFSLYPLTFSFSFLFRILCASITPNIVTQVTCASYIHNYTNRTHALFLRSQFNLHACHKHTDGNAHFRGCVQIGFGFVFGSQCQIAAFQTHAKHLPVSRYRYTQMVFFLRICALDFVCREILSQMLTLIV